MLSTEISVVVAIKLKMRISPTLTELRENLFTEFVNTEEAKSFHKRPVPTVFLEQSLLLF